MWRLRCQEFN
ncbi:hypothetical protein QTG54_013705 [Skeletonema marinoi]|uniref:Uncharacterized protein n=1 Tax=Skeletonema marinoi TaxID=267567 RepID=A0AAD8XXM6_9STRA|nr:hypothetical protein QTG54_013705 [Skeletonema marinoi]